MSRSKTAMFSSRAACRASAIGISPGERPDGSPCKDGRETGAMERSKSSPSQAPRSSTLSSLNCVRGRASSLSTLRMVGNEGLEDETPEFFLILPTL